MNDPRVAQLLSAAASEQRAQRPHLAVQYLEQVVAIAPDDHVFEKMIGNVQEAKARGGSVIAITSEGDTRMAAILDAQHDVVLAMPRTDALLTPIVMTIPLQLLAYHIAVRRGCDVDQPRNLAKSVTVE